jgi:hypothetical protein
MIRRRRLHRATFLAAGGYNIAWGLWSALNPQWLFRFSGLPPLNHPAIFACLAMVVGLYGVLYLDVARVPERGWLVAAVGLTGKILGPIGLADLIVRGVWPASTVVLCLMNDLIWWLPFGLYLYDAWPPRRDGSPR